MRIPDEDWRMVSDPFEDWRLYQHVTPLIDDPAAGSVLLIIAEADRNPPTLLACHTMKAFGVHWTELRLMKGSGIVTLGDCELLEPADSEDFVEPPFFRHPLQLGPEIRKFLETHSDEVQYRMKTPFHSHRGVIHAAGLTALRKAIAAVS